MADDAEKKNISRLDFKIDDAIKSLDKVDEKLKSIAKTSEAYANTISKNMKKGLDAGLLVDTKEIKKSANEAIVITKEMQEKAISEDKILRRKLILQNNEANNTIMKQNNKAANQQILDNERVAKSTENLYDKITQYAKTYVIYQGFNALKKGIQETIDEMVEMEYRMVEIDRVLNESSINIDNYRDKLVQLAYDYGNSFDNVSDITLRLAKAGFDAQESLALTEKTLLALNTAELNATEATDDMVAVMAQWGLMTGNANEEAKAYGDIIDKINKVADNFPTTSQDIMNALKKVSSAFNLAGADIDETIATIVAAEKASQRGGKVIGTALSNMVQQIKAEGKLNLAEQLGLDFFKDDAKTEFKPIMEIFQEMSDRMAQLKAQGKESSVEMQNLLELFTVFRRNIGASLLGEMAGGEESTYMQVFKMSVDSAGYSLQENEKYLKTAKAAQAQFNAELLKLKTNVWDNGLEDIFREMLKFGTDLVQNISKIIDTFGVLPTTVGLAVAAFTAFDKKMQAFTYDAKTGSIQLSGFMKSIADGTKAVRESSNSFGKSTVEVGKYATSLALSTAKTIALQVATIALNAAISMGLSFAITAIVSGIDNWIHKTENLIKANTELMQTAQDQADKIKLQRENLDDLSKQLEETANKYNELEDGDSEKAELTTKLYELQTEINKQLEGTGKQVNIINESLDNQGKKVLNINNEWERQVKILDQISYKQKVDEIEQLEAAMDAANAKLVGASISEFDDFWGAKASQLARAGVDITSIGSSFRTDVAKARFGTSDTNAYSFGLQDIEKLDIDTQVKYLNEWIDALKLAKNRGEDVNESLTFFRDKLAEVKQQQDDVTSTTEKYNNALKELYGDTYSLQGYQTVLQGIMDTYKDDESVKNLVSVLGQLNKDFADGKINSEQYFDALNKQISTIKENGKELSEGMQAVFGETTRYIAEGLQGAILAYQEGTQSFSEYQESLAQSSQSLLELYSIQNDLTYNPETNEWFNNQTKQVDDYAQSLQNASDTVLSFSEMLRGLGDSYDYIAEHANAAGEANFQMEDVSSQAYQNLATNFANSLANMYKTNYGYWQNITGDVGRAAEAIANEEMNVNEYVLNALLSNHENLNNLLNESNRQAQDATNKLGESTGKLLENLGKAIDQFDYNVNFDVTGGIYPGGNILNLITGQPFKPTSDLALKISGHGGTNIGNLAQSLQDFGKNFGSYISSNSNYKSLLDTIKPYSSVNTSGLSGYTPTNYSSPAKTPVGGGGSSSSSRSTPTYDTNDRVAEDEYKSQLNLFKAYVTEKERLEKRWVDKQKELGLLSNYDYVGITQERIERYKEYLDALEKATWMSEEDRLALEKEYTEKVEDLQVDYLKYLKNILNDEISALKKANSEKIQLIKDEADERIQALKDIKEEQDKLAEEEEYKNKRSEILENIAYWKQRTGRQAQESLKEAQKSLEELDKTWQEKQQEKAIEDRIAEIERQRDAEIKAIEKTQEEQIAAMQAKYDKIVSDFNKTGQLIYENDVNWSKQMTDKKVTLFADADSKIYANESTLTKNLYNQYKNNFIDPIKKELENINKINTQTAANVTKSTPAPKPEPQYVDYTVQRGDSLWAIASRIYGDGSQWTKIYDANKAVIGNNPNLIYAGQQYRIPKFHQGGIFGGLDEGTAILRRGEMVLKPEWTASMERMMRFLDNVSSGTTNNITNGPTIEVSGDLVRIDANISNKTDAEYLTRRVEKMIEDKFNIKK